MSEDNRLNPQITEIDIGVRDLRKIKIYPLALSDEIKLTETISKAITTYFEKSKIEGMSDIAITGFVVDLIKQNFQEIISFVVDENEVEVEALMGDITNFQAAGIARIIYEKNFEEAVKNAGSLSEMVKKLFLSDRPSPQFASDTDTVIPDSSVQSSLTEDSPEES